MPLDISCRPKAGGLDAPLRVAFFDNRWFLKYTNSINT